MVVVLAISTAIMLAVMIFVSFEKFFDEKKEEFMDFIRCKRKKKMMVEPKGCITPEPIMIRRPPPLETQNGPKNDDY